MLFLEDLLNIQCRLKYFEKKVLTVSESLSVGSILQTFLIVLKNPITTDFQLIGKSL